MRGAKTKRCRNVWTALSPAVFPAAPILDIKQVFEDEHIHGVREMFVEVEHPVAGKITITGNPIKMSETATKVRTPAPLLGESNDEIYQELGFDAQTISNYKAKQVI